MKNFPIRMVMKILFVDNSPDLQQKWIEPLRKKGWGVLRARSIEDADRMMILHGDALQAIVVGEKFVSFAEKNDFVFVVLIHQWGNTEILKHQNSDHSAIGYIPFSGSVNEIFSLFETKLEAKQIPLQATGSDGSAHGISLEDYSNILSQPETRRSQAPSFYLDSSPITLGGAEVIEFKPEVIAVDLSEASENTENRTVILETTKVNLDSISELILPDEINSLEELTFDSVPEFQAEVPLENHFSLERPKDSDNETLKSYLALREQDVAVLTGQLRSSHERMNQLDTLLKVERAKSAELSHLVSKQEQKLKSYDQEKQVELEVVEKQMDDLNQQLKERTDKARAIEAKLRLTSDEVEKVKERVRVDIRRIRVREKELENQLEIVKKDSQALLHSRDEKVIELKRKIDLLEFNMELVQEQYAKERQCSTELKSRLKEAASVMKQAGGMLEQ